MAKHVLSFPLEASEALTQSDAPTGLGKERRPLADFVRCRFVMFVFAAFVFSACATVPEPASEPVFEPASGTRVGEASAAAKPAPPSICPPQLEPPFYHLWEFAQDKCKATRCEIGLHRSISAIHVTWRNYSNTQREKPVQISIWADEGELPGKLLWHLEATTTLLAAGETRSVRYDVEPPLRHDVVWFGHRELDRGPPTAVFDFLPSNVHASSQPPCQAWKIQDIGDFLQSIE